MMNKHMIAATFLRLAMKKAERFFQPTPELLHQFKTELTEDIMELLDQILTRESL